MAVFRPKNNYVTDYEDTGFEPTVEDIIAQIVAPTPVVAPVASAIPAMPKTPTQVIKELVASGKFEQNPNQPVVIDGTIYQPVFNSSGSGENFELGPLQNVNVYKEAENKVGGNVYQYSPSGEYQQTTQQQEVNATKDFMEFLAMSGAMFGAPAAIGKSLGLSGAAAQAAGQALLTTGTQLGAGADLGDAIVSGLKSGAIPATGIALGNVETFTDLPKPTQAAISSAVGSVIASGGKLDTGTLLSAATAALGASNKENIGALEGLTNSGRTGDDMGGVYEPETPIETPVASLPNGIQLASLGETPFRIEQGGVPIYAESSGASAVRPPAGYEVMSASLADNKPTGAYYDPTVNAWLQPTNEFARITDSEQVLADLETFKSGINTIDADAIKNVVEESLSNYPTLTADDVASLISKQNFATPEDIQTAINSINIPQGLTSNDVTKILGQQNYATPEDIQTAINSIEFPQGLNQQDVTTIVSNVLTENPSLTTTQVSDIVDNAISKLPANMTAQDVINVIADQGLATSSQLTDQATNYQKALDEALASQATGFNTSLTGVQTNLESKLDAQGKQFLEELQNRGVGYQDALNEAIAAQSATYNTSLANTQSSVDDLAKNLGLTKDELLTQLNTTEANANQRIQDLEKEFNLQLSEAEQTLGGQIGNVQSSFEEQLAKANASNADAFAKVMLSLGAVGSTLGAIKDANTPKTYTYDVADTSKWASPVYNQATGPVAPPSPLDFGTRDLLQGTQWQKFLSPTYGQVPAPVQFNQPNGMGYDQLMSILGTGGDTLPSQALSINDVISGIQNQYGQAPKGSMG